MKERIVELLLCLCLIFCISCVNKKGINMYLFYDKDGILREQIIEPLRSGDTNKEIYAFFDSATPTQCFIQYELSNGSQYFPISELGLGEFVDAEIPFDKDRDLKYFEYHKTYNFMKFVIPENVLINTGVKGKEHEKRGIIGIEISCLINGEIANMQVTPVVVEKNSKTVIQNEGINVAQWNEILKWIGDGRFSIVDTLPDDFSLYVNQLVIVTDVATETFELYKVDDEGIETKLSISADVPQYIKAIAINGNQLIITQKDGTSITYEPTFLAKYEYEGVVGYSVISNALAKGYIVELRYAFENKPVDLHFESNDLSTETLYFGNVVKGNYIRASINSNDIWHDSVLPIQHTLTAGTNVSINNNVISFSGGGSGCGLFVATYGETSYFDLVTAKNNGNVIMCEYGEGYYIPMTEFTNNTFKFNGVIGGTFIEASVNMSRWDSVQKLPSYLNVAESITGQKSIIDRPVIFVNAANHSMWIQPNPNFTGGEVTLPNRAGTIATIEDVKNAFTPQTVSSCTIANNKMVFEVAKDNGLYFVSYGNCFIMIPSKSLQVNQRYKTTGVIIYGSMGENISGVVNFKWTDSTHLEVWSGESAQRQLYNGNVAYLIKIKLY